MLRSRLCLMPLFLLSLALTTSAQNLELNTAYNHISGDGGLDGLNIGASVWLTRRISVGLDYDTGWDNSHLGVFDLTETGLILSKNHLQNLLVVPRFYFPGLLQNKEKHIARLLPFAEAGFGYSHLHSSIEDPTASRSVSASDNAFSWMVGGGAEYRFSPHWASRFRFDYLRTHFSDTGQGRARFGIGIMYTFGRMFPTEAEQAAEAKRKADQELAAAETRRKARLDQAEAQKRATAEQIEVDRLAAEQAAAAKWKADADLAAAEARRKVAMEQLAAQQAANDSNVQPNPDEAKRKEEAEQTAADARQEALQQHEREKEVLRARLLEHFNRVLPTTDSPRGLVVNMGDVLFDTGRSDLRPEGREDLSKLCGIVINYPSLRLTIEGHSDNTGSAEMNKTLSAERAKAVRDYLVKQGLDANSLSEQGLGENNPVADNTTPEGRQKNRRVEIIVSGQVIGTLIGSGGSN